MECRRFESYPAWMVAAGTGVTVAIYALGMFVLSRFGPVPVVVYAAYCGYVEVAVMRGSCRHCHYYGRWCALGRGRLCSLLFQKGDPQRFLDRSVTLRDLIPDLLVSVIPLAGGVVSLVVGFDWGTLAGMMLLVLLATAGTGLVRGRLACRHCAQRELGCPAQELFGRQQA